MLLRLTGMLMTLRTAWIRFLFPPGLRFAVHLAVLSLMPGVIATRADDVTSKPGGGDFFESKVRPLLVEHCFQCHSAKAKSLKGGLRLDSFDAMRQGGDTGPAVVPGDVEASLLVRAVKYDDDVLRMPPKGKLPDASVAALAEWVRGGAIGPHATERAVATKSPGIDFESARTHWAYQPLREPAIPSVHNQSWQQSPVDSFVLASLEAARLTPSPRADRRTLIRRVYYDLIGLPPTARETEAFESDRLPDAFDRVVDRLLASPHYGERWGRHWLDVARYADTKDGVLMFGDDRVRPFAYTYRDYVIHAFNEDLGFDRFVHEQLAADLVARKDQSWRLAAMGFLTLGRMFDNNYHDQIDDRIDTVTRGFLGLTVACARCHDHKYDAIPTADYYSLYGVFASSEAPLELPLIERPGDPRRGSAFEKQVASKRRELREFVDSQYKLLSAAARTRTPDYLVHAATTSPDPLETAIFFLSLAPEDLRPQIVARWRRFLDQRAERNDPVFGPWHDLMALADSEYPANTAAIISRWRARRRGTQSGQLNPLIGELLSQASFRARADVARAYGELIRKVDEEERGSKASRSSAAENEARHQIAAILGDHDSPVYFPKSQIFSYLSRVEKDGFLGKLTELDRMAVKAEDASPRAMVLLDAEELCAPRIFVRGNPSQPGGPVPRQFLRVIAGPDRSPFPHGSGRLDLAQAITAPSNPLTSRVIVNRLWMHHFGEPMVSTPSDFGTRSTPPSHPKLLDYLAARLQRERWSIKAMHRLIMLSSTYQQASFDRPACQQVDPENRLLWRFHRRRLDLEAIRDTLLFVSGRLDREMEGRPVDVAGDSKNRRRTVYGMVDRQSLPGVFRAFDFASPDQSAERRPRTTVPQQALFVMNAPFVIEQAKALAARPDVAGASSAEARVVALYRAVLARSPIAAEAQAASRFLGVGDLTLVMPGSSSLSRIEELAQVLMMTNEFMFVD
jgi:Protein of unknown function (DUF1553)/Protein of unknown function (DUF1549)/Planctomycete cytochrome C